MRQPRRSSAGACDFAADPHRRADEVTIVWLPQLNPRMAILTPLPAALFAGPSLAAARPIPTASAADGDYLELLALPPANAALLLGGPAPAGGAVGIVLPFDALFEERIDTARRLYRLFRTGRAPLATISSYRRGRLKLALRALDGSQDGAEYRAIAEALFGARVPKGAAFRDDSLRAQAIRLVRYGLRLMHGGYLDLLRPERRATGRRRRR